MHTPTLRRLGSALALTALAGTAAAHPGHDTTSLAAGLAHPLGLDHLLAMAAVGTWSAGAFSGQRRLQGPAAFVLALLAGATGGLWLARQGLALPALELGLAFSVVLMGALLAVGRRLGTGAGLSLVVATGLLHGLAHGAELPAGGAFAPYAAGFVIGTGVLQLAGLALGDRISRLQARAQRWAWPVLGSVVGTAGLVLAAGV